MPHPLEFDEDHRFVADDPGVVSWCDPEDLSRLRLPAAPVFVFDMQHPGGEVAEV